MLAMKLNERQQLPLLTCSQQAKCSSNLRLDMQHICITPVMEHLSPKRSKNAACWKFVASHLESLLLQTSPGRKQEKRSPIVKLNKEQPQAPSISGTSVPVPSGQSWVTEDNQKFKWTWKRIALAVFTVAAIIVALLVAFSHPSSKIHHPDLSAYTEGMCQGRCDNFPAWSL